MTLFAYLAGSDVGHKVRLNAIGLTNNADGSVGFGSIVFDDADGTLTVRGWMKVVVKETACTSAPVLFSGYVGPRTYSRNTYRSGAARFIDTTLVDENAILHCRLITGSDGKRPAETHDVRVNWLLNSAYLSGLISDTSLVDTATMRPFEEADYRGQYADDVLNDVAGPIFRIFFVYPTQPNGTRGLFFDTPTSVVGTSTLTISNVLADQSATCFPPSIDATLSRDPSEVYSRIRYTYANGTVIEDDTSAVTDFFTDNAIGTRGLQVNNSRVGLASTARSMAQSLLSRADGENDTITVTVILPRASVGLIDAGQRIGVRFTHLPGYETLTYTRVTSRNIRQHEGTDEHYDVTLELNTHGLSSAGGAGAPPPGDFPHPPSTASIVQQISGQTAVTMPAPVTEGDTLVAVVNSRGASTWNYAAAGYTLVQAETQIGVSGGSQTFTVYKLAGAGESQTLNWVTNIHSGTWYELPGTWTPDTMDTSIGAGSPATSGPITVTSPSVTFAGTAYAQGGALDAYGGDMSSTPGAGWTEDYDARSASGTPVSWTAHRFDSGSITGSMTNAVGLVDQAGVDTTNWAAQVVAFIGDAGSNPPSPAQWVYDEVPTPTPDGTTTTFTLAFPFTDGSLIVKVDRLDQTAAVTSYDGAAGTFTLGFAPKVGELVEVTYQGR